MISNLDKLYNKIKLTKTNDTTLIGGFDITYKVKKIKKIFKKKKL